MLGPSMVWLSSARSDTSSSEANQESEPPSSDSGADHSLATPVPASPSDFHVRYGLPSVLMNGLGSIEPSSSPWQISGSSGEPL
jgi:hypothetical protein